MSQFRIDPDGGCFTVERDGVAVEIFATIEEARQYVANNKPAFDWNKCRAPEQTPEQVKAEKLAAAREVAIARRKLSEEFNRQLTQELNSFIVARGSR